VSRLTLEQAFQAEAIAYCSIIESVFGNCASYFVSEHFFEKCVDDIIGVDDLRLGAATVDTLARLCSKAAADDNTTLSLPTSGATSIAYGNGLNREISLSKPYKFVVQSKDANGVNCSVVEPDIFQISSTGLAPITFITTPIGDGKFNIEYTSPNVIDDYKIFIRYRGVDEVANSPFTVSTVVTSASQTIAFGEGIESEEVAIGELHLVFIQAKSVSGTNRDFGGDNFAVTLTNVGGIDGEIIDFGNGLYSFYYYQYQLGLFTISVKLNGNHISGSPFEQIAGL